VDWDTYENPGQEALMRASAFGSARDIREQVGAGANPNMAGQSGNNPLLAAYRRDNRDTFAALLDIGADPNVLPRESTQHNVAFAIIEDRDDIDRRRGYFDLLLAHGLDPNLGDDFGRLIHEAASSDDPQYLRMLIDRGVDANANRPWSPISTATMFAHYDKALLLLPYSSLENMEEAAGMLEERARRQHFIGDRDLREELIRQLKARGIDFDVAFAKLEAERKQRLEQALPPAGKQSSDGRSASDG
jgi:ankyrin repeat protein